MLFTVLTGLLALALLAAALILQAWLETRRLPDPPPYELDDFDRSIRRWGNVRVYRRGAK